MIKPIVTDTEFLAKPSEAATKADRQIVIDLRDTFEAHRDDCVGLAANMIGESKRIIIIEDGRKGLVLLNPQIIRRSGPYEAKESCLSIEGEHTVTRHMTVMVGYSDESFKRKVQTFQGYAAEIVEHEVDHCNGVLV